MATVPVKNYRHDDEGAPVISNNVGDIIAFLDAVLVNGFNPKTISTITRVGDVATASVPAGIVCRLHQVIRIANVNEAEYLGDQRVIAFTGTSFSFKVVGTPGSATSPGTITCKTAPLGFEILFTATNKRVYRSLNGLSLKPCLRVDATQLSGYTTTWQKFARVEMSTGYSDIDTATGAIAPYDFNNPNAGRAVTNTNYHGWAKWRQTYGISGSSQNAAENVNDLTGTRHWDAIGDDRGFYYFNRPAGPATLYGVSGQNGVVAPMYCFMEVKSFRPGDAYTALLAASDAYLSISTIVGHTGVDCQWLGSPLVTVGKFMLRDTTQVGGSLSVGVTVLNTNGTTAVDSGYAAGLAWPNPANNSLVLSPPYIQHSAGIRASVPGLFFIHNNLNRSLPNRTIIDGVDQYPDKKFLLISSSSNFTSAYEYTTYAFDLLGPWDR